MPPPAFFRPRRKKYDAGPEQNREKSSLIIDTPMFFGEAAYPDCFFLYAATIRPAAGPYKH
jgi:hypothetical protein